MITITDLTRVTNCLDCDCGEYECERGTTCSCGHDQTFHYDPETYGEPE